jgi:transposase-like protein
MPKEQEQRRQQAIDSYLAGNPIEDICRELACSKSWLYKWRDRYVANDPCWRQTLSRRPKTTPTKTPTCIEQVVVSLRHTLAQNGQACGATSIVNVHVVGAKIVVR